MRLIVILFAIFSVSAQGQTCDGILEVKSETDKTVTYCRSEELMVSEDCQKLGAKCELLVQLKAKKEFLKSKKPMAQSFTKNPGSYACTEMGWKVMMGKMADESDICMCDHPNGQSIVCTSLLEILH